MLYGRAGEGGCCSLLLFCFCPLYDYILTELRLLARLTSSRISAGFRDSSDCPTSRAFTGWLLEVVSCSYLVPS